MSNRYDDLLASMPMGLERAILRVLSMHVGRDQAVGREGLVLAEDVYG